MKLLSLIDYGAGNIHSVFNALKRVIREESLEIVVNITNNPTDIENSDYIILPGVGSFKACMDGILACEGLKTALDKAVLQDKKPFLGICVGMQLLAQKGFEYGEHHGLGYLQGNVKPFILSSDYKIPHMGWNKINISKNHPILDGISSKDFVYFVHSYYMETLGENNLVTCDYGLKFPAIVGRDNIVGVQFHPEKSQKIGLRLLRNFLTWKI